MVSLLAFAALGVPEPTHPRPPSEDTTAVDPPDPRLEEGWELLARGRYGESRALARRLIDEAHAKRDRLGAARATMLIGALHLEVYELEEAQETLYAAYDDAAIERDARLQAEVAQRLARVAYQRDDLDTASRWARTAQSSAQALGDPAIEAATLLTAAEVRQALGDAEHSEELLRAALSAARAAEDDPALEANIVAAMATVAFEQDRRERALRLQREAVETLRAVLPTTRPGLAQMLTGLAVFELRMGNVDEADRLAFEAAEALEAAGHADRVAMALLLHAWASIALAHSNPKLAERRLLRAIEIFERFDDAVPTIRASAHTNLAVLALENGDNDGALHHATTAVELARPLYGLAHPDTWKYQMVLAVVHKRMGRRDRALDLNLELIESLEGDPDSALRLAPVLVNAAQLLDDDERSVAMLERAIAIFEQTTGWERDLGVAWLNLGVARSGREHWAAADAAFERAEANLDANDLAGAVARIERAKAQLALGQTKRAVEGARAGARIILEKDRVAPRLQDDVLEAANVLWRARRRREARRLVRRGIDAARELGFEPELLVAWEPPSRSRQRQGAPDQPAP